MMWMCECALPTFKNGWYFRGWWHRIKKKEEYIILHKHENAEENGILTLILFD